MHNNESPHIERTASGDKKDKQVKVIGGIENKWGKKQYRMQDRVYESKMCCICLSAERQIGLVVRKWKKK